MGWIPRFWNGVILGEEETLWISQSAVMENQILEVADNNKT